jgi:hypothetical protein
MFEYSAAHFDELCRAEGVGAEIRTIEDKRRAAVKRFWLYLLGGLALCAAAFWSLSAAGWESAGIIVAIVLLVLVVIAAAYPLSQVSADLKHPALEALAAKGGMEYWPDGFDPPLYGAARDTLFGSWLSSQTFTDLLTGADSEGRRYAVYEACLQRQSGKHSHTVFSGQVYALERPPGRTSGVTAIVPDRGLFNFFKPGRGMERVRIEGDSAFEKKFEVYSTHPLEAKQLLFDSELRRRLLALREGGPVFTFVGPGEALVAATGKNRFEPGSMFRRKSGEERVRLMFDDVCASMEVLRGLRKSLA